MRMTVSKCAQSAMDTKRMLMLARNSFGRRQQACPATYKELQSKRHHPVSTIGGSHQVSRPEGRESSPPGQQAGGQSSPGLTHCPDSQQCQAWMAPLVTEGVRLAWEEVRLVLGWVLWEWGMSWQTMKHSHSQPRWLHQHSRPDEDNSNRQVHSRALCSQAS